MPYKYTEQDKAEALRILTETYGDITATSMQTGIPARTLRYWRQRARHTIPPANGQNGKLPKKFHAGNNHETANPEANLTPAEEAAGEFENLRAQLMKHIFSLAASLTDDPNTAHLRAVALARLLDRVVKLDTLIPAYHPEEHEIIFKFEYPDGSMHDHPPWEIPQPPKPQQKDLLQAADGAYYNSTYNTNTPSTTEQDHDNAAPNPSIRFW